MTNGEAITLRVARASDADGVTGLMAVLGYSIDRDSAAARLSRLLDRPDDLLLIASAGQHPVGFLHVTIWEFIESDACAVVAALVVAKSARQRGIGRELMGRAEDWAREHHCQVIRLWSSEARAGAHEFYERLGYRKIKTHFAFAKALNADADDDLKALVPRIEN